MQNLSWEMGLSLTSKFTKAVRHLGTLCILTQMPFLSCSKVYITSIPSVVHSKPQLFDGMKWSGCQFIFIKMCGSIHFSFNLYKTYYFLFLTSSYSFLTVYITCLSCPLKTTNFSSKELVRMSIYLHQNVWVYTFFIQLE